MFEAKDRRSDEKHLNLLTYGYHAPFAELSLSHRVFRHQDLEATKEDTTVLPASSGGHAMNGGKIQHANAYHTKNHLLFKFKLSFSGRHPIIFLSNISHSLRLQKI